MGQILWILWIFSLVLFIQGHVFDCLGKCKCYPEYRIIQCPTGLRNQLGLTSKADIEGFQVNEKKSTQEFQELKVVPEGTFKVPTTIAPKKRGKGSRRPRRDLEVWSMGIRQTLNCYMIPGWMAPIQNVAD
ncbi:hypothetical protein GCK72_001677 [Caenorhabditis remanei]|uniref:Uncharacterized protein n=1 Tax=Caenorhabditis remanei TaxID=31234 RepID=A0A6A5HNP0_CAERE|nr:hypothetical protein GCK72_001677 [Caenorhabditis remanei]KAF1769860.1 hypothetical protein GCK72_001677 [Caenorhabditis remanei]